MNVKHAAAIAALGLAVALAPPAIAQSPSIKPFPLGGSTFSTTTGVKIAVTYQFFIEGQTQTMENQASLADQGRKHLYLMLAKECVVLKQTIAATCAIERASVNAQLRQRSRRKNSGVRVSGSVSYRIVLKKDQK
jgi:hypothetical protein